MGSRASPPFSSHFSIIIAKTPHLSPFKIRIFPGNCTAAQKYAHFGGAFLLQIQLFFNKNQPYILFSTYLLLSLQKF